MAPTNLAELGLVAVAVHVVLLETCGDHAAACLVIIVLLGLVVEFERGLTLRVVVKLPNAQSVLAPRS